MQNACRVNYKCISHYIVYSESKNIIGKQNTFCKSCSKYIVRNFLQILQPFFHRITKKNMRLLIPYEKTHNLAFFSYSKGTRYIFLILVKKETIFFFMYSKTLIFRDI